MIPKISNYKELILDHNLTPIFNGEPTMFDINYIGRQFSYPYLETKIDTSKRDIIFNKLKKEPSSLFLQTGEIIAHVNVNGSNFYCVIKDDEVISYIEISMDYIILDYDCIPKYQRQGYVFIIMIFLLKLGRTLIVKNITSDLCTLGRLVKSVLKRSFFKIIDYDEYISIEMTNKLDLLSYESDVEFKTFLRQYSTHGVFAYSESYEKWFV